MKVKVKVNKLRMLIGGEEVLTSCNNSDKVL